MSLRTWSQARREQRARRYLTTHQDVARAVLRRDTELASQLVLQAAANSPERQTMLYPVMGHMGLGRGHGVHTTLPKPTPANLRRFSEAPPARRAINAITDPIVELPWRIKLVPPDDHDSTKPLPKPTADQHQRILAATQMFREPNDETGWRTFIEECAEDIVDYGAGSIELAPTYDSKRPCYFWNVDTASIRIDVHWDGDPHSYRYAQSFGAGGYGVASHEMVQLRDEELLYIRLNPRSSTPFGLGYLEVAFNAINAFFGAFDFAERRASNSTPNHIIFLGEHIGLPQLKQWQAYWENEVEGQGKVPLIGGGTAPTAIQLTGAGQDPLWLQWQEFLLRIIAISFGLSPQKLGVERDVNRNTAEVSAASDWDSISPVAQAISYALTSKILHKRLGWRDLQFTWQLSEGDKLQQATILEKHYGMNAVTIDEIREIEGRPPLENGLGKMTKIEYETHFTIMAQPKIEPAAEKKAPPSRSAA